MSFIYTLRTLDGDEVGEVDLAEPVHPGAEIRGSGNRRLLVLAVAPTERVSEFTDQPLYGVLTVEPLDE